MRIPLDYYRILGLPTQSTPEQLQQAHRDRVLQLPRREYSEAAITARRELLDEAYALLSDPQDRKQYDARFFQQTSTLGRAVTGRSAQDGEGDDGAQTPMITIEDRQLVGALLLLQELGEYELVLKYGTNYLQQSKGKSAPLGEAVELVSADIMLTVALAYLELGREHWQQSQYEKAGSVLEAGQDLLLREGLFASVRGEIRHDLYRLRPYRILELVSQPLDNLPQRRKGLQILRDMLQERGGIDGHGDDQSGLGIDDFLRFVQQLRDYLSAEEQQDLFENESRRPSAVASYLAVYALMARGFAEHQPSLVHRAKAMLLRLGKRQDVHLEQAVCALMLGQTEEASRALELSHEYEPLAFIREHSHGSPDLLPGLCLYAERWLQEEVFPHFRDLNQRSASLKAYFADLEVQNYLESLAMSPEAASQWEVMPERTSVVGTVAMGVAAVGGAAVGGAAIASNLTNGARVAATTSGVAANAPVGTSTTYRVAQPVPPSVQHMGQGTPSGAAANGQRRGTAMLESPGAAVSMAGAAAGATGLAMGFGSGAADGPAPERQGPPPSSRRSRRAAGGALGRLSALKLGRLLLLFLAGMFSLWLLLFLLSRALGLFTGGGGNDTTQRLEKDQLMISLNDPLIEGLGAAVESNSVTTEGALTQVAAQQAIELWLRVKAEAFGAQHKLTNLPNILTGSALAYWQEEAERSKGEGIAITYEHTVKVEGVEVTPDKPDQATVKATVREIARYTQSGASIASRDDESLRMSYDLERQDGKWRIAAMNVQ